MPTKQSSLLKKLIEKLISLDEKSLFKAVCECNDFKMKIVVQDEKDKRGIREVLNFGHTAGHAFEILSKGKLSHGAAIIWGMRFAYLLSIELNIVEKQYRCDIEKLIWHIKLPALSSAGLNFKDFNKQIQNDKKTGSYQNRFILIKKPGSLKAKNNICHGLLKETLLLLGS